MEKTMERRGEEKEGMEVEGCEDVREDEERG